MKKKTNKCAFQNKAVNYITVLNGNIRSRTGKDKEGEQSVIIIS